MNRAQQEKGQVFYPPSANDFNRAVPAQATPAMPQTSKSEKQVFAIPGPIMPLWLGEGRDEKLVVARLVQIGEKPACQVTIVDWPALQKLLADEVRDLFPDAHFRRIQGASPKVYSAAQFVMFDGQALSKLLWCADYFWAMPIQGDNFNPELAMTQLPIELDPGPAEPIIANLAAPRQERMPLRVGLGLAWTAALGALITVGLGGWSLIDLSERRIRFVSAVTHELRTPMTTLRLYLDMLTGGLIRDEKQKEEYLHTLNAETDRLNRLIGNVLDFSRLENQRPRLNKTTIAASELLQQVAATWEGRVTMPARNWSSTTRSPLRPCCTPMSNWCNRFSAISSTMRASTAGMPPISASGCAPAWTAIFWCWRWKIAVPVCRCANSGQSSVLFGVVEVRT